MQVQRQALERAAAAAPEIEEEIRSGLRGVGPDSKEASAGIRGWATAAALDKATAGWISKLNTIADHVGEFEPKLKATAENFEHAEKNTTELIQRLRAW